jgi:hypothetical protein
MASMLQHNSKLESHAIFQHNSYLEEHFCNILVNWDAGVWIFS